MPQDPIHLVIGTPCYGGMVTNSYLTSLLRLSDFCAQQNVRLTFSMSWGDALVTRARQNITAYFLNQTQATHLLFIDADIGFEPKEVRRLLESGYDVCAGLYPLKRYDWNKIKEEVRKNEDHPETSSLSYVIESQKQYHLRKGFALVAYVGTGFLMIRRRALESMVERYPELRYRAAGAKGEETHYAFFDCFIDEQGNYLPEDFSFCRRWTDMGGFIWADFNSRLNHTGVEIFKGDLTRSFKRDLSLKTSDRSS